MSIKKFIKVLNKKNTINCFDELLVPNSCTLILCVFFSLFDLGLLYKFDWWTFSIQSNKWMVLIILRRWKYWHLKILNLIFEEFQLLINWIILNNNYITLTKWQTFFHCIELFLWMRITIADWTNHVQSMTCFFPINVLIIKFIVKHFTF